MKLSTAEIIMAAKRAATYPAGVAQGAWFDDCPPGKAGGFYLATLQQRLAKREALEHG